jgi:hypothetical protein
LFISFFFWFNCDVFDRFWPWISKIMTRPAPAAFRY